MLKRFCDMCSKETEKDHSIDIDMCETCGKKFKKWLKEQEE